MGDGIENPDQPEILNSIVNDDRSKYNLLKNAK